MRPGQSPTEVVSKSKSLVYGLLPHLRRGMDYILCSRSDIEHRTSDGAMMLVEGGSGEGGRDGPLA